MAVTETLGPEELAVTGAAVDLLVGAVASQHRVQRPVTLRAIEALLVPHLEILRLVSLLPLTNVTIYVRTQR